MPLPIDSFENSLLNHTSLTKYHLPSIDATNKTEIGLE